jgi:hypothetical protein
MVRSLSLVRKITAAMAARTAGHYMNVDTMVFVIVGHATEIEKQVAPLGLGTIERVDLAAF